MADPTPTPDPTPMPDPAPTPTPAPSDPPQDPAPADPDDGKGGKDAILADLARERDKRQALETSVADMQAKQQEQMDALAKALGLKTDEPPDPEKLAAQVTVEQDKARDAQLQLAIYRNAAAAEGNADLLVDSSSFKAATKDIDPADGAAMSTAIKAFVEANPAFKVTQEVPPTPRFPGGPRTPAPTGAGTLGDAIASKIARPRS